MAHVAVLICHPDRPAIDGATLSAAADALPHPAAPRWLDPGSAAEIGFARPDADHATIEARLRQALSGLPIDVAVLPERGRKKRLLVADMDSTMIEQECIDELADVARLKAKVSAITERAMRGEIAFEPALRERVALLRGLPVTVVDDVLKERITLMSGGPALLATMRANGAYAALVSGGFTLFTEKIAARLGFHEHRANVLGVKDAHLDGTVAEPILGREAKREALIALTRRLSLPPESTLAVGDGANDLAMLGEAGLGVALHAKPKVAEAARVRIDHGDLTALLFLQGYERSAFAA
jgi:phosphoserine phosphatase